MTVLIIDNDAGTREGLQALLKNLCPQIRQIQQCNGIADGIATITSSKPDLVFLDVELDEGTGFDLLQQLGSYNFKLVFITAHNKYAVKAFKFSAIDFLLKPVDPLDLVVAVNKAEASMAINELEQQLQVLKESLSQTSHSNKQTRKVALNDGNSIHYVKIEDIIVCKADSSYTHFYLTAGKKLMVSKLLKDYEELFEDFGFLRTHHSYLINSSKIVKFNKSEGGQLHLEENHIVPVSARKRDHVLQLLGKL